MNTSCVKLLLVNPNTSAFVTDRMVNALGQSLGSWAQVVGVTAVDGPAIVADRQGNGLAAASSLQLGLRHGEGFDAVIVGISTDAGLDPLRQALRKPVVGMMESALLTARQRGGRIGFMTLGPQMLPLYEERAALAGLHELVVAWTAPSLQAAYASSTGPEVDDALIAHAASFIALHRLDVLVMCGAVLAGCRPRLAPRLPALVIDAAEAAAWQALALARQD